MNSDNDSTPDEDEHELLPMMDLLKRLEPTLASRVENRRTVAAELRNREWQLPECPQPWWRRSISVPIPVALVGALLSAAALVSWPILGASPHDFTASVKSAAPPNRANAVAELSKSIGENSDQRVDYRATETYLCGIGRIRHESIYEYQE
jgi:hypothetical protein